MIRLLDFMLKAWKDRAAIDSARIGFFGFSKGGYTGWCSPVPLSISRGLHFTAPTTLDFASRFVAVMFRKTWRATVGLKLQCWPILRQAWLSRRTPWHPSTSRYRSGDPMETCAEVTAGGAVSVCADPGSTAAANMIEVAKATSAPRLVIISRRSNLFIAYLLRSLRTQKTASRRGRFRAALALFPAVGPLLAGRARHLSAKGQSDLASRYSGL